MVPFMLAYDINTNMLLHVVYPKIYAPNIHLPAIKQLENCCMSFQITLLQVTCHLLLLVAMQVNCVS